MELLFIILLANYIVDPPALHAYTTNSTTEALRDVYILIYSFSSLFFSRKLSIFSFVLAFLTFLLSYPELPIPGFTSFNLLLLAFFVRLFQYHTAYPPSPLFLLTPDHILPLVHILTFHMKQTFIPVVLFFVPVSLFILILLAYSNLYDLDTRLLFALVLCVIILLSIFFLLSFAPSSITQLRYDSLPPGLELRHPSWDRYSSQIGLKARRSFICAISIYGRPNVFPPPFSLLQLLMIVLPRAVLSLLRTRYKKKMDTAERVLWRLIVGPFTVLFGAVGSLLSPAARDRRVARDESSVA